MPLTFCRACFIDSHPAAVLARAVARQPGVLYDRRLSLWLFGQSDAPPLLSLAVVSGGLLVLMALALRLLRAGYKLPLSAAHKTLLALLLPY